MKTILGFAILMILGIVLAAAEETAQTDQGDMRSARDSADPSATGSQRRDGKFLGLLGLGLGLGYPYGGFGPYGYGYGYPYGGGFGPYGGGPYGGGPYGPYWG